MRKSLLIAAFCLIAPAFVQGGEVSGEHNSDQLNDEIIVNGDSSTLYEPGVQGLEYLVPELEGHTFQFSGTTSPYLHRLGFSPGIGTLGDEPLTSFRLSYAPTSWLEYEASVGHNPGKSVHALVHLLNARLRHPIPYRVQPYVSFGFGMILVFPGPSLNASPVTKNVLSAGGGLEIFLRDDVAIRGELRRLGVFGRDEQLGESAVFGYGEATVGFSFYRRLEH